MAPVKAPFSWPNRVDSIRVSRDGAAIHRHEGLALAVARSLDGARQDFLADARFAFDEHRDGGFGGALGEPDDPTHVGALGDEVAEAQRPRGAPAHAPDFALERIDAQGVLDRDLQALRPDRLDDEIDGAGAHRRDHRLDGAVRRLHDDRRFDAAFAQLRHEAEPVEVGHDEVDDGDVDALALRRAQESKRLVAALGDHRLITEAAHHGLEEPALNGIVVDDENGAGHEAASRRCFVSVRCSSKGVKLSLMARSRRARHGRVDRAPLLSDMSAVPGTDC